MPPKLRKRFQIRAPEIKRIEEIATDTVISTIIKAKEKVGERMNLEQFAKAAAYAFSRDKVSLKSIEPPIAITTEKFLKDTIEKHWKLTQVFKYYLRYMGHSKDETSQYFYYEAIFSQPTADYPIPQATVSVFFRVEEKLIDLNPGVPLLCFRIEGHHTDHDVRYVTLIPDWLLAVIQMKIKCFKRIEALRMF